jgi:zinc protease
MRLHSAACRLLLSLALLLPAFLAHAQETPPGITKADSIEGITEYRLDNGLRVLLAPDDSKPTTTVNMTYLVGSRREGYGQTGMAHLLEHMLFRGTPRLRMPMTEFSKRGLRANGSTTEDRTNFFASFASSPDTLKWYLGWQADAMVNSLIAKEDLDSEMTVVRNEMENGENDPLRMLIQKMQATAYQWHSYGKNTIGARSDVENVDVGQLQAFYHQYYQPDDAVLIVAGKFDPQAALADIHDTLGKLPRPKRTLPPEYTVEPPQDGEHTVTLRRTGGTPLVAALYHIPAGGSPDFVPMDLATIMLSDTPSGRLYHALVAAKQATNVFGYAAEQRDPGYVLFGAQLEAAMDPDTALGTLTTTLESLQANPFTQEELDRARNKWLTNWQQTYNDPEQVGIALSEAIASGDWRLFFLERDEVRKATLADVQRVAAAYLLRDNRTSGRYLPTATPERAPLATRPDLAQLLKDYHGNADFTAAAAFDSSPANIDKLTQRLTLDLPNGPVQLALLPKPTRGNRVQARLLMQYGDAALLRGQRVPLSIAADLLMRGTPKLTRQDIEDRLDQLQADVSFEGSGTDLLLSLSTTRDNLPELIGLMLDVLRNANYPESELAEYKRQAVTAIQSAMTEPPSLASRAIARQYNFWPSDDVRYVPTFEESLADLQSLTRDQVVAAHDHFYGAGRISFSAVGDFDPAAVQSALTQGLKDWQRAPAYTRLDDPYHDIPPKRFEIATPDKANAFYLSRAPLHLQDTDPDYPALTLANYLLGAIETSRLWNRVRVKEGLSYNVRSTLSASSFEPNGSWTIYAIYAPQNKARVESAIADELSRALKDGFTEADVRDGINALLSYRKLSRAQDESVAGAWIDYMETGRSFQWSADMDEKLKALTPEVVNAALRKYLKPEMFSTAEAGDFAAKK